MFGYEIWFDGCCVRYESGFDSYEEAKEEANEEIAYMLEEVEGYEDEDRDSFDIEIFEWGLRNQPLFLSHFVKSLTIFGLSVSYSNMKR